MRLRISLNVLTEVSGNTLPISYQYELSQIFFQLLTADTEVYHRWLEANGFSPADPHLPLLYSISNLYIPKILVKEDRLEIGVPRIQFWVSFLVDYDTRLLLDNALLNKVFSIGDSFSSVSFQVAEISDVSPVVFHRSMEYQTLSPVVVKALRQNGSLEYLNPLNPVFSQFIVEDLIERWENFYQCKYKGSRAYSFTLLSPEKRKSVITQSNNTLPIRTVAYMIKFRLELAPELQEFAYVAGLGDDICHGFGYLELIRKRK